MKIFLVDDSPHFIERLKEMLAPLSSVEIVGCAGDIPEAKRSIRTTVPDVVLLDLNLPGGSGIELLRALKADSPEVKVIVLTNYAFPQYKKKCLTLGAYAFLDKSTDFTSVPELLSALAGTAHLPETSPHSNLVHEPSTKVAS